MKVQSLKGTIFHIDASPISQLLIDAGIAIPVAEAPPKPAQVQWSVFRSDRNLKLYIQASLHSERTLFTGPNAAQQKFHGESCPADVAAEYAAHYKNYRVPKPATDENGALV